MEPRAPLSCLTLAPYRAAPFQKKSLQQASDSKMAYADNPMLAKGMDLGTFPSAYPKVA